MKELAEAIIDLAERRSATVEQLRPAVQAFFDGLQSCSQEDAVAGLTVLGRGISGPNLETAAFVAMICGALVERGAPAGVIAGPLMERLASSASGARRFAEACTTAIPPGETDGDAFDTAARQMATALPDEFSCWQAIEKLFPPAIAVLSVDPQARKRGQPMLSDLAAISEHNEGAMWLAKMLRILHDEPFLALEPATGLGIAGSMSGISENFQLNVLLMDCFPGGSPRRVPAEAVAVAKGEGPQQSDLIITGCWNLCSWKAARADGSLPERSDGSSKDHWIWNEGTPADIPVFQGVRVILLGPPAYVRTWRSQRDFAHLHAELKVEQTLDRNEVDQWMQRVRAGADA